jgi:methionyl aminopeptidase
MRLKSKTEIEYIRKSNRIIAEIFEKLKPYMRAGITTREIDKIAEDHIFSRGARPAFKGYTPAFGFPPYPASTCVSVNEQVIHGIPGDYILREGDIVSVDIGTELAGYYGDATYTYLIGEVSDEIRALSENTFQALYEAISVCKKGNYLNEIGKAIDFFLKPFGYGIVRDYCGHGVGNAIHEPPPILNYFDPKRKGPRLQKGMVLAIEPMITLGSYKVKTLPDKWTLVTEDGKPAAHWEHSVAITDGEADILSVI